MTANRNAPRSRRHAAAAAVALLLMGTLSGCRAAGEHRPPEPGRAAPGRGGPYVLVLGTAQDAGLPQIGCSAACCERAWREPSFRRRVSSLLVADPSSGGRWLLDATPDLVDQVELARSHPPGRLKGGPRPPLFDGVYLTHAHMGHVLGLAWFGAEAYGARELPVFGSRRMVGFLNGHEPWALMARSGHVHPTEIPIGRALTLPGPDGTPVPGLSITAWTVPHRDEVTDTLAYVLRGPRRSLLFLPDIDKWERWDTPLEEMLASVDIALVDGTFYADGEIPGRSLADIPHPFISETIARLASQPASLRAKLYFTHLNHTNPAADPDSDAARTIRAAGMHVAHDGQLFEL